MRSKAKSVLYFPYSVQVCYISPKSVLYFPQVCYICPLMLDYANNSLDT